MKKTDLSILYIIFYMMIMIFVVIASCIAMLSPHHGYCDLKNDKKEIVVDSTTTIPVHFEDNTFQAI